MITFERREDLDKAFAPRVTGTRSPGRRSRWELPLYQFIAVAITGIQQLAPEIGL
jgi:hypothetical protein